MSTGLIYKGSMQDIATKEGQSVAKVGMGVKHVYIIDTSGSMGATLSTGVTLYDRACDELRKLQERRPGQCVVFAFSSSVVMCSGGKPTYLAASTDLAKALEYTHKLDGTVEDFTLISDGYPDDPNSALVVAQRYTTKINTVYVGMDDPTAVWFLQQLSAISGGKFAKTAVDNIDDTITKMLTAGPTR